MRLTTMGRLISSHKKHLNLNSKHSKTSAIQARQSDKASRIVILVKTYEALCVSRPGRIN